MQCFIANRNLFSFCRDILEMNGYGYGWSFATELMHGYHHHKWNSCTPWLHLLQHALLLRPWQPASQVLALNRQWSWTLGKKLPKHRHSRIAQKWNLNRSQWKRHVWIETPPCGVDFAGSLQPQRFQSTGNAVLTLLWSCQSLRNISTCSILRDTFPPWHQFWTLSTRADLHSKRVNSALTLRGITHLVHSAHSPSRCVPMSQSRMRQKHHARCNSRITESFLQIGHWDLTIPQTSYWCKSTPKELVVETSSSTSSTSPSSPSSCSPRDLVWLELENR